MGRCKWQLLPGAAHPLSFWAFFSSLFNVSSTFLLFCISRPSFKLTTPHPHHHHPLYAAFSPPVCVMNVCQCSSPNCNTHSPFQCKPSAPSAAKTNKWCFKYKENITSFYKLLINFCNIYTHCFISASWSFKCNAALNSAFCCCQQRRVFTQ